MSGPADLPPADHPLLGDALGILDDLVAFPSVALTPNVDLIGWVVDRLDGVASDVRLSHDPTGTKAFGRHARATPITPAGSRSAAILRLTRYQQLYTTNC